MLVGGRRLRCAKCAHDWVPDGPAAAPGAGASAEAPPPMPSADTLAAILAPVLAAGQSDLAPPAAVAAGLPETPAMASLAEPHASPVVSVDDRPILVEPRGGIALRVAWFASVLALVALGAAGWVFRVELGAAWPPAQRVLSLGEWFRGG